MSAEINRRINERMAESAGNEYSPANEQDNANAKYINRSAGITYIPILRLRVADIYPNPKQNTDVVCSGTVQIWRPTEEMLLYLKEGKRFRFFNLTSNIIRDGEVQFRATKTTRFKQILNNNAFEKLLKEHNAQLSHTSSKASPNFGYRRKLTHIDKIISSAGFNPEFQEVDIVGILVNIEDIKWSSEQGSPVPLEKKSILNKRSRNFDTLSDRSQFETIYVCDTSFNFLAIKFWNSVQAFGYENLIKEPSTADRACSPASCKKSPNTVLYIKNLQWRPFSSRENMVHPMNHEDIEESCGGLLLPSLFMTEQTAITKNPTESEPSIYLEEIHAEMGKGLVGIKFLEQAKLRLRNLLSGGISTKKPFSPNVNQSNYDQNTPVKLPMHRNPQVPGRKDINTPDENKQFKLPRASPSTPLTYRQRNEVITRAFNCENFLVKGNVETVPGSPAEMQSRKTKSKIKALEQAAVKLTYWNP